MPTVPKVKHVSCLSAKPNKKSKRKTSSHQLAKASIALGGCALKVAIPISRQCQSVKTRKFRTRSHEENERTGLSENQIRACCEGMNLLSRIYQIQGTCLAGLGAGSSDVSILFGNNAENVYSLRFESTLPYVLGSMT